MWAGSDAGFDFDPSIGIYCHKRNYALICGNEDINIY